MLRFTLSLLIGLCFTSLQAQITITSSHMPKSGDTIRYSTAPITDLPDLTKTGTNFTWDFSQLGLSGQNIYQYKASAQTPYILNFGFSAVGLKIADTLGTGQLQLKNLYNFFKTSTSGYDNVGIGFSYSSFPLPQSGKHSDPDEIYAFPLTYNKTSNTTFSVTVPIMLSIVPVGNFFQTGTRQTVVDGWGTITTPYASNVACIRVKSVIDSKDSVAITTPALNFGIPTRRVEYKWLSTTERIPMLEISGVETAGTFAPTYIRYRDNYREVQNNLGPLADFVLGKTTLNKGDTLSITDASTGFVQTYAWTISPATFTYVKGTSASSKNQAVVFNTAGTYSVALKVSNPAGSNTKTMNNAITVNNTSGIESRPANSNLLFPQPCRGSVNISGNFKDYVLYDLRGSIMEEGHVVSNSIIFDQQNCYRGIYLLQLKTEDGAVMRQKIDIRQ